MRHAVILIALALAACAQPGYTYDVGSLTPHPTIGTCASRGQVLDPNTRDCATPPPAPPPTPMQVAQAQQSNAATSERNACVTAATAKFKRGADGQVATYAIWRAEMKQCDDLMLVGLSRKN